ncbi:MAG TPA: LysE family transporter [Bacteroidales bacterium]|nr:LysE family transporter [Bacteroidales bacterium]
MQPNLSDMLVDYIWKGVVIGLSASIPLGPIGIVTIQRTLSKGRVSGFISGMGAASADAMYAIIAGFSISIIIDFIVKFQNIIKIAGGILLLVIAWRLFFANPAKELRKQLKQKNKGFWGDFLSTFALTASNPIGLFVFMAVFAGFGLIEQDINYLSVLLLIVGVFAGACLWWFTLTLLVSIFRDKFKLRRLLVVNKIAAALVLLFALFIFSTMLFPSIQERNVPDSIKRKPTTTTSIQLPESYRLQSATKQVVYLT